MPVVTVTDLLEACRVNRILDGPQLDAVAAMVPAPSDPNALARELVRRGFLTVWQVNQIIKGRARELLLGSYLLLEKLGEGGMGAVYKACNWKLGQIVAVKVIRKERLDNEATIRRFHREIQAAGKLWHPNIVRALDADEVNGTHFFVMEYVEGRDLFHVVKERGPLPVTEACDYIRQAALGLQHAFERGLVHRDIKPSNLLLTGTRDEERGTNATPLAPRPSPLVPVVKLLDMGLARFEREAEEHSSTLTQEGAIMGTPDYIAPEQARDSHAADIRADIYSLGCTLYFLLTGKVPFPGGTLTEKLLKHQMDTPTHLRQLRPDVPPEVAQMAAKLMAKRPEERFQTPAEFAVALENLNPSRETITAVSRSAEQTLPAVANPFADIDLPASATLAVESSPRGSKPASRRSWKLIAASISGALLAGVVLIAVLMSGGKKTETTADSTPSKKPDEPTRLKKLSQKEKDDLVAKERGEAEQKRRAEAEEALKPLITKAGDAKTTFAEFAKEVATFKGKFGGTPAAIKTAELLMKLPSPLDQLDPKKLPQDCIDFWRAEGHEPPGELVGVLGELRGRFASPIRGIAWGSTGKLLAIAGADGVIQLCDSATLKPGRRLKGSSPIATTDGRLLALRDGSIVQWKSLDGVPIESVLVKDVQGAGGLASTPDGRLLATIHGSDTIRIWDLTGPKPREKGLLKWPPGNIAAAFDAEGKRLIGWSQDKTIRLWDIQGDAPKELATITGHSDWVSGATITADGKTLVSIGTHDYTLRLWDVGQREPKPGPVMSFGTAGCKMATSADGKTLAIDMWTGVIWIVDLTAEGPKCRYVLGQGNTDGKPHLHTALAFSPDGKTLAASDTNYPNNITLQLWDVATGKEVQPLTGHAASANAVSYSPDCLRLLSGGSDKSLRLWDMVNGKELRTFPVAKSVASIELLPDGKHFAYAGDGTLSVSDLDRDTPAWSVEGETLSRLALSPDGRLVFVGRNDGNAYAWNTGSGKQAGRFAGNLQQIRAVAVSPDCRMVAVGSGNHEQQKGDVRVMEIARAHALYQWPHTTPVYCTAFSPDGTSIAAGSQGGVIKIWNLKTGTEQASLSHGSHVHGAVALAFAPDGRTLASLGYWQDKPTLLIWDTIGSKLLKELSVLGRPNDIAFAHDGRHLATANGNGTVYILRIADGPPRALSAQEAKKQQEDEAKRLAVPVQMENSIGMKLNLIPAGRFLMGSPENEPGRVVDEGPQHEVTISKPFHIGVYDVTQAEYQKITGKNPSRFKINQGGGWDHPVETVSWEDAVNFCKQLSDLPEEKMACRVYRLPTEAEWEYACRAGTQTAYSYGENPNKWAEYGWFNGNSLGKTHTVGQKSANSWGLHDMQGNVFHWCADWYGENYYKESPRTDPQGPAKGDIRVCRGASWNQGGRIALRNHNFPLHTSSENGFRVVCDCRPPQITNSISMKLARIPAGKFLMGSPENEPGRQGNEGPQHEVTITKPFHIGVYEVTQAEYEKVTGKNPSKFNKANGGGPDHPVEMVSWDDAIAFCKKLTELPDEKKAGRVYRLPTEAEWEYASRAGTRTAYSFGEDGSKLGVYAWYAENSPGTTHPVGQKLPNRWGLYDMHGNVWEWTVGGAFGERGSRGGGFLNTHAPHLRSAQRGTVPVNETDRKDHQGFRVVCDVQPAAQAGK
jgi:formylglycine-generating enzyme required for sulfatase activity/WD40 repeat protein/serine/threonine protein kinase